VLSQHPLLAVEPVTPCNQLLLLLLVLLLLLLLLLQLQNKLLRQLLHSYYCFRLKRLQGQPCLVRMRTRLLGVARANTLTG
jgi:hypothetical protein